MLPICSLGHRAALACLCGDLRDIHPGARPPRPQGQPGDDAGLPPLHGRQPRQNGRPAGCRRPHPRQSGPRPVPGRVGKNPAQWIFLGIFGFFMVFCFFIYFPRRESF